MAHKVIERTRREAPNTNGYFVQNAHGATVAGPFIDKSTAWDKAKAMDAKKAKCPNPRDCGDPSCEGDCGY